MEKKIRKNLLREQITILEAAAAVLTESYNRVGVIIKKKAPSLSIEEKESCEALTARFARLNDFLFQRMFKTLDTIELLDEGTLIDRLNRMEKRGIISSASNWRELRELRNAIAHEYLIESSDKVLIDAFHYVPEMLETVQKLKAYVKKKKY